MRKLDDILRILSSVLLGAIVKDIESLLSNLETFLENGIVAVMTAVVLIATFLRNIHGSARYDALVEEREYTPDFERKTFGRAMAFLLAVGGLFFGPFFAANRLTHHLSPGYPVARAALLLFLPFAIYAVWDLLLWLSNPELPRKKVVRGPRIDEVAHTWMRINAVGLLLLMTLVGYWLFLMGRGETLPPVYMAIGFIVIGSVVIVGDYVLNAEFYFPAKENGESEGSML